MKKLKFIGALLLAGGILLRSGEAVAGAQRAMRLWVSGVAPALFPFLVLMPLLTGPEACAAYGALFAPVMQPLFRLPGQAASAVVISMIAGSPGGAIAVEEIAAQSRMKRGQAWRVALAGTGVSPAFLIAAVGRGMYGSVAVGARLAAIQMGTQVLLLFIMRFFFDEEKEIVPLIPVETLINPVRRAMEQVLSICGYMVFFSSVGAVTSALLGAKVGKLILLLVDLPSGLMELAGWNFPAARFALGTAIGLGGLCIAMQNMDVLRAMGLPVRVYAAVRVVSAVIMGTVCMYVLPANNTQSSIRLNNPASSYAFSILIAVILAVPGMIYLSKKYFLNKRELGKTGSRI